MSPISRRTVFIGLLAGLLSITLMTQEADAKRLGGGRSIGRQSENVTQKQAVPAQAAPAQAAPSQAGASPAAAAPGPAGNRWMGPLAGLAAGLGIAALLSHFGMGGALADILGPMLLIGLLVAGGLFLFRMLRGARQPALGQPAFASAPVAPRAAVEPTFAAPAYAATPTVEAPSAGGTTATWTIPADFDVDNFLHIAKMYYIRLQTAWDAGNQADLRDFTTPEMFAEIKLDLSDRGSAKNQTDVVTLDAKLLGIEEQGEQTLASVSLSGMIREAADAPAEPFNEVWNLVKPSAAKGSWVLAGIQQVH
jgi:predicted lipid-binding transport protein (Tim44 family)